MPLTKIHVLEGRYNEARLGKVSNAVQHGLINALGIPPEDFFQIIHVLPPSQFLHTRSFLGLHYSDDLILLEITFIAGRPKEKRLGLLKALNGGVVAAAVTIPVIASAQSLTEAQARAVIAPWYSLFNQPVQDNAGETPEVPTTKVFEESHLFEEVHQAAAFLGHRRFRWRSEQRPCWN